MTSVHVIKIGGAVINDTGLLQSLLKGLAALPEPFVLVHGGGRKVDEWLLKTGMKPNMIDGRRITDGPTLELAVMNYAGLLNKQIVSYLQSCQQNALGLTGADLNCIRAHRRVHPEIDYGFVGDIDYVDGKVFSDLCHRGVTPVCCAITHDQEGQLLNTNADTIACEISIALSGLTKTHLWYGFEKEGVMVDIDDPSSLVKELTPERYQSMTADGTIHTGMKPKLHNCFRALEAGVESVHICNASQLTNIPVASGTQIMASL